MKRILLILCSLLVAGTIQSQSAIGFGGKQFNLGAGYGNKGIPIYAGMDIGVHPDISVGFDVSYVGYNESIGNASWDHNVFGLGGLANYHFNSLFNIPQNWDVYVGLGLRYYFYNSPETYSGTAGSELGLNFQLGGRYYFTDHLGINLEIRSSTVIGGGKIGLSYIL